MSSKVLTGFICHCLLTVLNGWGLSHYVCFPFREPGLSFFCTLTVVYNTVPVCPVTSLVQRCISHRIYTNVSIMFQCSIFQFSLFFKLMPILCFFNAKLNVFVFAP